MTLPSVMKGLQIVEFKKPYKISHDIPVPEITRDNEILIKVAVAGYCHTDVAVSNGAFAQRMSAAGNALPMIPSHECTGIVAAVGSKVTKFKVSLHRKSLNAY